MAPRTTLAARAVNALIQEIADGGEQPGQAHYTASPRTAALILGAAEKQVGRRPSPDGAAVALLAADVRASRAPRLPATRGVSPAATLTGSPVTLRPAGVAAAVAAFRARTGDAGWEHWPAAAAEPAGEEAVRTSVFLARKVERGCGTHGPHEDEVWESHTLAGEPTPEQRRRIRDACPWPPYVVQPGFTWRASGPVTSPMSWEDLAAMLEARRRDDGVSAPAPAEADPPRQDPAGFEQPRTKHELAVEAGIRSFDPALPQGWLDQVRALTGEYPAGDFVWSYDPPCEVFGGPAPVTDAGRVLLARLPQHLGGPAEESLGGRG